jgi:hypothetical protein
MPDGIARIAARTNGARSDERSLHADCAWDARGLHEVFAWANASNTKAAPAALKSAASRLQKTPENAAASGRTSIRGGRRK